MISDRRDEAGAHGGRKHILRSRSGSSIATNDRRLGDRAVQHFRDVAMLRTLLVRRKPVKARPARVQPAVLTIVGDDKCVSRKSRNTPNCFRPWCSSRVPVGI